MHRFPSGHVLPPPLPTVALMLISLTFILAKMAPFYSSGKGTLLHVECGESLGPKKHEISKGKRRHHETKAPYENVADGRTELRSARLFCCLDDLAVFLFSHYVLAACSTMTPHWSARATCLRRGMFRRHATMMAVPITSARTAVAFRTIRHR